MPCYNHEQYIAQAIESCLAQTYKNIEIIVCSKKNIYNIFISCIAFVIDLKPLKKRMSFN